MTTAAQTDNGRRISMTDQMRENLRTSWRETMAMFEATERTFACRCSASGSQGTCPFSGSSAQELEAHYRSWHGWEVALCRGCGEPQRTASCETREHWGV